jgi:hypothetical protein
MLQSSARVEDDTFGHLVELTSPFDILVIFVLMSFVWLLIGRFWWSVGIVTAAAAGLSLGQAYDATEVRPIYAGNSQGQTFHFDCGTVPTLLRARIRAKGKPGAPLKWALQKHNYMEHLTETVVEGVLVDAGKARQGWAWVQATLPAITGALPPECHYFALVSDGGRAESGSCSDCWGVWSGNSICARSGAFL